MSAKLAVKSRTLGPVVGGVGRAADLGHRCSSGAPAWPQALRPGHLSPGSLPESLDFTPGRVAAYSACPVQEEQGVGLGPGNLSFTPGCLDRVIAGSETLLV